MSCYNYPSPNIIASSNYDNSLLLDLLFKYSWKEEVRSKVLYLPSVIGVVKGVKELAKDV